MRVLLLSFLCCWVSAGWAQTGNYFLSHFNLGYDRVDNVCFDMVQDERGLIYFATRKGIVQFDGREWTTISSNGSVYSIQLTSSGEIYWAGAAGFGILAPDKRGVLQATVLSENVSDVFQVLASHDKIFFLTPNNLFILSKDRKLTRIESNEATTFKQLFELFGMIYVSTENGAYKVHNETLTPSNLPYADQVIFTAANQHQYLVGLSTNKVFLCREDLQLHEVKLQDQQYLDASVVTTARWINKSLFVLGTLRGGLMFVNAQTGQTQEIINYATGLPDNEIFALMNDRSQGVWAAHEYGFTRIAPYLPLRSFHHYPGLQGNLLCAYSFRNQVYVGTSLGVFKLEKEDLYDEISYYVDVEIPPAKQPTTPQKQQPPAVKTEEPKEEPVQQPQSKKKGFLGFLRKDRNKDKAKEESAQRVEKEETPDQQPASPVTENKPKPVYKKVKKTERVLRASQFVFKKVKGINAKIDQLLILNDKLLASGLAGVFEITDLNAVAVLEEPSRYAFATTDNLLIVSTYSDDVKAFRTEGSQWKQQDLFTAIDDQVHFIYEGREKDLWFCAKKKIYHAKRENQALQIESIPMHNPNQDQFAGIRYNNEVIVTNAQGFYRFDQDQNKFVLIDSLSRFRLFNYFTAEHTVLFKTIHGWSAFGTQNEDSNLQMLNLFPDIRNVAADETSANLWIITSRNELYRYYGERFTPYASGFPLFLKSIRTSEGRLGEKTNLRFEQESGAILFAVAQPDYIAPHAIEYRYMLEGLDDSWTDWSNTNNNMDFPYLPSGDYILKVQSKDIFGSVQEMRSVVFEVLPPYWQRPWFYALEFSVFASLVVLSFRLSARYRIISRLLMLLTIIMLIQFIQTGAGEIFETRDTPVIDFFVQVCIAIVILPVEGYLRNLMLKSLESPNALYKLFASRAAPKSLDQHKP